MKNVNILVSIVALAAVTMIAVPTQAGVVLPTGLAPGSQYQIAFVTAGLTDATSGLESTYNSFVQGEAGLLNAVLPIGTSWSAITSTYDGTSYHNAHDNALTYTGVPIYDTQGNELSSGGAGFWSGTLLAPIQYDQTGSGVTTTPRLMPWTGSDPYGDAYPTVALGQATPVFGVSINSSTLWIDDTTGPSADLHPIYALSSPITVAPVPEPLTMTLVGMGIAGLGGYIRRRRAAK